MILHGCDCCSPSLKKERFTNMVKTTKRARKFATSGGVKKRLEKGTITNKGKLKRKKRPEKNADRPSKQPKVDSYSEEQKQKRRDEDMTSQKNLGDLSMDSFFSSFTDDVEEAMDREEQDIAKQSKDNESSDDEEEDNVVSKSSDDEDDHSSSSEQESQTAKKAKSSSKNAKKSTNKDDDSDDSSDDDEDLEAAEKRMKKELEGLRKNDPEFHEFLEENDEELLEYGGGDDSDDDDDDDNMSEDGGLDATTHDRSESMEAETEPVSGNAIILTPQMLRKLEQGAFQSHGLKSLKKFVSAYKSACHMADTDKDEKKQKGKEYHIESSKVFDRLMVTSLAQCHDEFHYHLLGKGSEEKAPLHKKKDKSTSTPEKKEDGQEESEEFDENKPINPKLLEKSRRWSEVKPILYSFLKSSIHLISEAKEPDLVTFVLKALSKYIPYATPFPRVAEAMLKTLTTLWSAPIDSSEDYQVVRLHAFLRVRQLALTQPFPFIEESLKKLYLAYAQRAKFAGGSSVTSALPTLTFMGNCVVELYSLDYHSSYQHAFVYIRQLALHLRTAMQKKTQESFAAVYCWQFLHCLKLWVAVLTEACQPKEEASNEDQLMRSLLFPLSQVIIGTCRLIPSTRYLPLRLHCVRLLQQLAAAAEVFLPTTSILMEALDLRELYLSPKKVQKSTVQPLALTFRLRADNPLRTMEELEMCVSEIFVLLNREADLYRFSAGFPEFSIGVCQRLRKVSKLRVSLFLLFMLELNTSVVQCFLTSILL